MGTEKLCACDRTCQAPLSADIDHIDTVKEPFLNIIKGLSDVKDGLWLSPFRGIPRGPQVSRFDVIYLDENCRVLGYAVNFAEAEFEPIPEIAASALILPPHTLASFSIRNGDQLTICRDRVAIAGTQAAPFNGTSSCSMFSSQSATPTPIASIEKPDAKPETAAASVEEPKPSLIVRFLRRVFPKPPSTDRRRDERIPQPDLVAYYWTGGSPNSYPLGNVSGGGLYLLTDERWLPGTRIVMTLQRRNGDAARAEDVCRVESQIVRWGNDGVGCQFVESGFFDLNNGEVIEDKKFDREAFDRFLLRVK